VDKAIKLKTTYDVLKKNKQFVELNLEKIEKVIEKKELYTQTIESVQFGFVSLESDFKRLSEEFRLSKLKMEYNKNSFLKKNADSVPIKLFFYGSLIDALNFMNYLEKDSPYIRINSVKSVFEKNSVEPGFELKLMYKYRVSARQI